MRYIKKVKTGHYHPPYRTEEITREIAIAEIGEETLKLLEHRTTSNLVSATQIVSANNTDYEIGVEF